MGVEDRGDHENGRVEGVFRFGRVMDQLKCREDEGALEETVDGRVKEMKSGNEGEGKSKKQKGTSFGKVSLR